MILQVHRNLKNLNGHNVSDHDTFVTVEDSNLNTKYLRVYIFQLRRKYL